MKFARHHHGLVTTEAARVSGATPREIQWRVQTGRWERIHRNVFRIAGLAESWEQRLHAAALWAGEDAAASHRSAGELWRLDAVPAGLVEISTERRLQSPQVIVHRMRVGADERVMWRSIPTTDPTRTLLDLGAVLTLKELERALESALRRRLTHLPLVERRLEERGRRGRNGTRAWRELLQLRASAARPTESDFETLMTQLIRNAGLPEPVRQLEIRHAGKFVKRADFAYPDEKVVIEADGVDPHLNSDQWRRDRKQENWLNLIGWTVLRFTRLEVVEDADHVAATIRQALQLRLSTHSMEGTSR